ANGVTSDPKVLKGTAGVEDTRTMFRNMVRPPASSNVIMASSRDGVSSLPNAAKEKMASYLMENPELLAKIASFYPVESLAEKLSKTAEEPQVAKDIPEVISIENLTKEAAERLGIRERQDMLSRGYAVIDGPEKNASLVLSLDKAAESLVLDTGLEEYGPEKQYHPKEDTHEIFLAEVLVRTGAGFAVKPALVTAQKVFFKGGDCIRRAGKILLRGKKSPVTREEIIAFTGAVEASGLKAALPEDGSYTSAIYITPARNGNWHFHEDHEARIRREDVRSVNDLFILKDHIFVTPDIRSGSMNDGQTTLLPAASLFAVIPDEMRDLDFSLVYGMNNLVETIRHLGRPLRVLKDGVDIRIQSQEKTACFAKEADAARHLQSTYGLTSGQIERVLSSRESVLCKVADGAFAPYGPMAGQEMPAATEADTPAFDPSMLEGFAGMEDPELMDTGILSAFAEDPDIRSLLIDYIQDFLTQEDRLGRIILLFTLNRRDLEQSYGMDKLGKILASCRKIFKFIGELVESLRQYTSHSGV
ncbi:MAG: hypothetical protein ACI4P0_06535, partial [Mailhella sp.]